MTVRIKWDATKLKTVTANEMVKRVRQAVVFLRSETVKGLNRTQPVIRSGRGKRGLNPSKPGEFPKRVSDTLRNSITTEVKKDNDKIVGRYGTNVKDYPLALEFGTRRGLKARPFLRPPFFDNQDVLKKILVK